VRALIRHSYFHSYATLAAAENTFGDERRVALRTSGDCQCPFGIQKFITLFSFIMFIAHSLSDRQELQGGPGPLPSFHSQAISNHNTFVIALLMS